MKFLYNNSNIYNSRYFLYKYNDTYSKLVLLKNCRLSGFEDISSENKIPTDKEEIERVSLSRTKKSIKEIALCNDFEYFVTFTVNSLYCDRFSLVNCQNKLKELLKSYKRKYKSFAYLIITEKHKDGAFHFHGLIKGFSLSDLYINDNGYLSSFHFDKLGFNSFAIIDDYNKCCNYITKYISKECVKNDTNQIYFCSRGLKRATREELSYIENDNWDYTNEFCCIKNIIRKC